jgi:hypothetical protein
MFSERKGDILVALLQEATNHKQSKAIPIQKIDKAYT